MNIGFIELIKFAKTDVESYVRRGKNGPVKVKKHRRKYVEAAGTLLGGGSIVGAALLMVRKKHTIKKTGKFDSSNPTEWLEKQAKANADEANSVVEVLSKGRPNVQKPKREPDIWDEPLAPFSTLADRPKSQQRQPLLLPPAKPKRPDTLSPTIVNDEIFPIVPGAYFHGARNPITGLNSGYKAPYGTNEALGRGLYATPNIKVAKNYAGKKDSPTIYQLLHVNKDLEDQLLDMDADISDTIAKMYENMLGVKLKPDTVDKIKKYGKSINSLQEIHVNPDKSSFADRTVYGTDIVRSSLADTLDDLIDAADEIGDKVTKKRYREARREILSTFGSFFPTPTIKMLTEYLRTNSNYRGLKGRQLINPEEGEYKVYWYPEQDLRVERVM